MEKILLKSYFESKNTAKIAQKLLGKFLVRKYQGKVKTYLITEVEAYDGFQDKASHAHHGKTERNKIMFGPAGYWYVYFTYGMHWMLNIVTGPKDYPAAILIRAIKGTSGPGRITKALHIKGKLRRPKGVGAPTETSGLNGKPANIKTGLWIEDTGVKIKSNEIRSASRIGVAYAGSLWSKKKWRFYLEAKID